MNRRAFLRKAAVALGALAFGPFDRALSGASSGVGVVEIAATASEDMTGVFFDPIGIFIEPGTTVRWRLERSFHSTTAYHPQFGNRELRIPEEAEPWDSGMLLAPGSTFEVTLTVPGVYDYFCAPHEFAGMVGRIIVGRAEGPGALPFNYGAARGWNPVPKAAQAAFPSIEAILAEGIVRAGALDSSP